MFSNCMTPKKSLYLLFFPFRIDLYSESDTRSPQISDSEMIIDLENQLRMAKETIAILKLNCAEKDVKMSNLELKINYLESKIKTIENKSQVEKSCDLSVRKFNARC